MSHTLYETPAIAISRHVGPAAEGADRRRFQITTGPGGYAELTLRERSDLRSAIDAAILDASRGPHGV